MRSGKLPVDLAHPGLGAVAGVDADERVDLTAADACIPDDL
jgi:hypothetical protein